MIHRSAGAARHEQGIALLMSVLILLLMGAIAIAAIEYSGEELAAGGRARSSAKTLAGADAGIQFALNRLSQLPPDVTAFTVTLPNGVNVQSRRRDQGAPQPIQDLGTTGGPARVDGHMINIGGGGPSFSNNFFLVNVTATDAAGATAELEVKAGGLTAGSGGY